MNRRRFLSACSGTVLAAAAAATRPNILFVLADQFRADAVAINGNSFVHTPNLDGLARSGVRFANAYASQALCAPCRGSLLTGVYPHTTKLDHNVYNVPNLLQNPEFKLTPHWPGLLRDAGYESAYIGKWHLGDADPGIFDYYNGYNSLLPHWLGKPYESPYRADVETDDAIRILKRKRTQSLALMVSYYPPHNPYSAPKRFHEYYAGRKLEHMEYYAAVSAIDWNVGRLLEALKANGLEQNTLVIFSADHGDTFGKRPGTSLPSPKTVCYDDSAKVPLIMRWPAGLPSGLTYRGGVSSVDIMPTILEAAGVPIPSRVQGRSRIREMQAKDLGWKDPVFIENITHTPIGDSKITVERAVRTERWKLILRDHVRHELYDMQADPGETNDLFSRPEHAATIKQLARLIQDWGRRSGDRVAEDVAGKV